MSSNGERARRRNPETGIYVTKLDDDVIEKVCLALKAGAPPDTAAAYAGISRSTYHEWMRAGRNGGTPTQRRFVAAVDATLAEWEVTLLARIANAKDWRADAWTLERRRPDKYGQTSRVNVGGPDGEPLRVEHEHRHRLDLGKLTDEKLANLEQLLEEASEGEPADILQLPPGRPAADDG